MNIKKHYKYLDLSFDATEQQVLDREKIMIKMIRSQTAQKRDEKKIAKVANSANAIINFLHTGGKVEKSELVFENSVKNVFSQFLTMLFVMLLAIYSFIAFTF